VTRAAAIAAVSAGLALGGIWASGAFGDPGIPGTPATVFRTVTETRTVDRRIEGWNAAVWRAHAVANRRALNARDRKIQSFDHRLRGLERASRRAWAPTVTYAIRLASAVYGVPEAKMRAVAYCESTDNPYAVNGRYQGLFQLGWAPFGFSPFDPVASALSTAQTVVRDGGWRQWSCG
jgi:hypothetical protein